MQRTPSAGVVAAGLLTFGAAALALARVSGLGLLGPDSWPLLWAAQGGGGLSGPLFGDLQPAPYYRPVLHASLALDRALYGFTPLGYHASTALLYAACGAALFGLARSTGLATAGALTALAFFLLHPVHGVVLPVVARRADVLCLLFLLLALVAQLRATQARKSSIPAALLAVLSIGSKETGFVAPVLCVVAAAVGPGLEGSRERLRSLARALPPHLAVLLAALALRFFLLGDLSGGRPVRESGLAAAIPQTAWRVLVESFSARAVWPDARFPAAALGLVVVLATSQALRSAAAGRVLAPLAIAAFGLLGVATGYAIGAQLQPWYLLLPAAFAALALGSALDLTRGAGGAPPERVRVVALVAAVAFVLATVAAHSFLLRGLDAWERADRQTSRYWSRLAQAIEASAAGEPVVAPAPPAFAGGEPRMRGVVVLAPYSGEAWARIHFPGRELRFDAKREARATVEAPSAPRRPSVLLVIADDLGYADLGFQGNDEIRTPRLDQLAAESARFVQAYVSAPLCAPTRAALLTGRDANRFDYAGPTGTFAEQVSGDVGVPLEETLLSEALQAAGYRTGAVGKWHLGVRPPYRPLRRGFDSFFGFLAGTHAYFDWSGGLWGPVFRGDERVLGDTYLTDAFADEAIAFLEQDDERPFFLYLAFHAVHGPLEAPETELARYSHVEPAERRALAAMTTALDTAVGRVLDALDATGRADDTLVFFLSDNGGVSGLSSNSPLRGGKGDLYEGGIRVPFLLRWPPAVAPGVVTSRVSASLDVYPTVAAVAELPDDGRVRDGRSLLPIASLPLQPRPLRWRFGDARAMRRGQWKLVDKPDSKELFHILDDPGERRDLSGDFPRRVEGMRRALDLWEQQLAAPSAEDP